MFRRTFSVFLCIFFSLQQAGLAQVGGSAALPVSFSQAGVSGMFRPAHLRAVSYASPAGSLDVLMDKGDVPEPERGEAYQRAVTFFFIGLALPEDAFWVNLRPDSPERMIDDELARTDLGKVLLEADLQLKKDTALCTSPATREGKEYWERLYRKAEELFGTAEVEIPTLARPWIVPGEIIVRESGGSAYVYKATLQVKLEQDHLKGSVAYDFRDERMRRLNEYASGLLRELIIPALTREVNSSRRYAQLRQAYYSLILAAWFREKFRGVPGECSRRIGSGELRGLESGIAWNREGYFRAYKASFEKGEYSLRENVGGRVRSYVSGGIAMPLAEVRSAIGAGTVRGRAGGFTAPGFTEALSVTAGNTIVVTQGSGWEGPGSTQAARDGGLFDRGFPVDRVLSGLDLKRFPMATLHPVEAYAAAFRGFAHRARRVLGVGRTALAVELADGSVLKISLSDPFARRAHNPAFDTELIERGTRRLSSGATIHYIIQPRLEMNATTADILAFKDSIRPYRFEDIAPGQVGFNRKTGRWELADPGAVIAPAPGNYGKVSGALSQSVTLSEGEQQRIAGRLTGFILERLERYKEQSDIRAEYGADWEEWQTIRVTGYENLVFKQNHFYPSRLGYDNEVHEMSVAARNVPGEELLVDGMLLLSLPGLAAFKYGTRGSSDGFRIMQEHAPAAERSELEQVLGILESNGMSTRDIRMEDIGIVEKHGVRMPVLVNLSKVFYQGRTSGASAQRDGGARQRLEGYRADIEQGVEEGIILRVGEDTSGLGEKYSHINTGLTTDNTRGLSSAASRLFWGILGGKDSVRVIDLGAGAGKACSDMFQMARAWGKKIAIELAGYSPVAPRLLFRGAWKDIRDAAGVSRVALEEALGMSFSGQPAFERLADPYIQKQYIGDFLDPRVRPEGTFDFIYDSFGAVFYAAREKGMQVVLGKVFRLMGRESVFLMDSLSVRSMRELTATGLPSGYAGFVCAADSSVLIVDTRSLHFLRLSRYLADTVPRGRNVYLVDDLGPVTEIMQGRPAEISSKGRLDAEVFELVQQAAKELSRPGAEITKGRELLRYSEEFNGFWKQVDRLGLGMLALGTLANVSHILNRDGGAMREKLELKRAAVIAAGEYSPSQVGNCVDATRRIAALLADSGILFRERQVNVPFDFRDTDAGAATTSHTILEAVVGDEDVVVDTQLRQFKENSNFNASWEFVDRYVYNAREYYSKVNAYNDAMCLERIRASSLRDGGMSGKFIEHYRGIGGYEYIMVKVTGDSLALGYELESESSSANFVRVNKDWSTTVLSPAEGAAVLPQLISLADGLRETLETKGFSAFMRKFGNGVSAVRDGGTIRVTQGRGFSVEMEGSRAVLDELGALAQAVTVGFDEDAEFTEDMGLIIGTLRDGAYHITRLVRVTEFAPDSKPEYLLPSAEGLVRLIDANVREGEMVLGAYHNHSHMRLLSGQKPGPSGPDFPGLADILAIPHRQDKIAGDLLGLVLEPEVNDMPLDRIASFHPRDCKVLVHAWVTHSGGGRGNYTYDRAESAPYLDSLSPARDGGAERTQELGGVDFRSIRENMRVSGSGDVLKRFARKEGVSDVEGEWRRIEKMRDAGLSMSAERLGEFAAACSAQGALEAYAQELLGCIASMLRMEEQKAEPTGRALRELLAALEEG